MRRDTENRLHNLGTAGYWEIDVDVLSNRDKVISFLITLNLGTKSLITTSVCAAAVCGHFINSLYTVVDETQQKLLHQFYHLLNLQRKPQTVF